MERLETLLITSYDHKRRLNDLNIKGIGKLVSKRRHDIYGKNQLPSWIRTTLRTEDTGVRVEAVIPHDALMDLTMIVEGSQTGWKVKAKTKQLIIIFQSARYCSKAQAMDWFAEGLAQRRFRRELVLDTK